LFLVQKVSLASVLDLPGPMTVFAPSSAAFSAMPEGQLDWLSSTEVRLSFTYTPHTLLK